MSFAVVVPKPIQKQLDDLPASVLDRAIEKIQELKDRPRPAGCVKLKGHQNEYRIRIGAYRIRYEIDDQKSVVVLLHCGHRKDIYRNDGTVVMR